VKQGPRMVSHDRLSRSRFRRSRGALVSRHMHNALDARIADRCQASCAPRVQAHLERFVDREQGLHFGEVQRRCLKQSPKLHLGYLLLMLLLWPVRAGSPRPARR
jgi:hypothetical protein